MPNYTLEYQLRIRNASTVSNPNGTADALTITSVAGGTNPYIAAAPNGDGQEIDPVTGQTRTGSYVVEVVDVATSTDSTGTVRVVTSQLEDAGFLQQLLGRRAYVEIRRDGGAWSSLIAGYVLAVRLISPVRYAITIGDTRRVEQTQPIFRGAALGTFATRGTFIGGPVTADFGPSKARGGWRFRLDQVGASNDWTATFLEGYAPTIGAPLTRDLSKLLDLEQFNRIISGYARPNPFFNSGASASDWAFGTLDEAGAISDGVVAYIGSSSTNATATGALLVDSSETHLDNPLEFGRLSLYWPACPYASGSTIYLSLTTADVRDECPLYLDEHPVDIVTAIWTAARIQYDPAGAWIATARAAIGANVRLALRFTQVPKIAEFIEEAICGPFGLAVRTNGSGDQELVVTRVGTTATPSLTIAAADLVSADPVVFDLDERTAINSITLTQTVFGVAPTNFGRQGGQPADGIVAAEISQTARYVDAALTTFAGRDITFRVPGMIHTAADFTPNPTDTLNAIGRNILPRFGRGSPVAEVQVLATAASAAVQVGDEVFVGAPHYPNRNYRIGESTVGARIMQVVRRTETPIGPHLRLIDSGINAQPVSPAATITIAASTANPYAIARFTITNAATINSGGVLGVEVEWGTGATPTSNGIVNRYLPGAVPTGAVDLPAVTGSGVQVQVRARTTQTGRRPSAWTAWQSVTLTAIPTPGAITVGTTTATSVAISWTNTSTVFPLFVYAYLGGSAPANWAPFLVTTLPPGSTSTVIRTLEAGTYQLALAYSTPTGPGPVRTASVTTSGAGTTATRPAGLAIIPLLDDATLPQGIALGLYPSDQTLDFVIERSTTSGSGFAELARVPGSSATYVDRLPRDGTTYYYRAKHALGGFVTSAATGEVSDIARGVPAEVLLPASVGVIVRVETTETSIHGTVTLLITDPQGRLTQVRFRNRTNGGAWSVWVVDTSPPYQLIGILPSSGFLDIEYEVSAFDVDGIERVVAGGIESFDAGTAADMASVVGTFGINGNFILAVSADTDTASIRVATSTISQPNLATTQGQTAINARNYSNTFAGPYEIGAIFYVSCLAYTAINGGGTESGLFEYQFQRGASGIICLATQSASSPTQVTSTVTATDPTGAAISGAQVQLVGLNGPSTGAATLASGAAATVWVSAPASWVWNRGTPLSGDSFATFKARRSATLTNETDDDTFTIVEQGRDTKPVISRARELSTSTATVAKVRVAVNVPDPYTASTATIRYSTQGLTGVSPADSSGNTVTTGTGNFASPETVNSFIDFDVPRPAVGQPAGMITFTATATGYAADTDPVAIAPVATTQSLLARARVTSTTATQVVVRVAVASPVALSPNTATIAYSETGVSGTSPASGQTVMPETSNSISEAAGSFVDFTITRPAIGAAPGRVTFSVTATDRVAAIDAVDVVPQERVGPSLRIVTTPSTSSFSLVITWDGTIAYDLDGVSQSVSGWTSPRTETITRNDYSEASKVAAFSVTKDSVTTSESVNILAKDITSASITIGTQSADDATNVYTFTWTGAGFPTGTTYDLQYRTVTTGGDVEEGYLTGQTSPVNVTSGYTIGVNPTYQMTVTALNSNTVLMTRSRSGTFLT